MKFLILLSIIIAPLASRGQLIFKGQILDDSTGEPLPLARVFINNSTKGAIADAEGRFKMEIEPGRHEVIVNYLGFATITYLLNTADLRENYIFRLSPVALELSEIEVKATRDNVWYTNLALFKQHFLGTSDRARKSKILNEDKLIFDFDASSRILTAKSREPLIISNPSLGYEIEYLLEKFEFDRKNGFVYFEGYPLYREMEGSRGNKNRWAKEREKVYNGSVMHFVRTIYNSVDLENEGFLLRKLERVKDTTSTQIPRGLVLDSQNSSRISLSQQALPAAKTRDVLYSPLIKGSEIIEEIEGEKVIPNPGHLFQIIYSKAKEELAYAGPRNRPGPQTSIITINGDYLVLENNGNYFPPMNLFFEGYWAWMKVADMLPLDFSLEE